MSRTSTILFLTEDYADRLDALYREAQAAEAEAEKAAASRRMVDSSRLDSAREAFNALKAEAEAAGTRVTVQAIGRREWRALKDKHPPRTEGDPDMVKQDRLAGVNVDTIEDDLVYASLVEPKFDNRAQYDEWADQLVEADFQAILGRAWQLVNVARTDPKSLPASPTPSGDVSAR